MRKKEDGKSLALIYMVEFGTVTAPVSDGGKCAVKGQSGAVGFL